MAVLVAPVAAIGPAAAAQPSGSLSQSEYHVIRGESVSIGFSHTDAATLVVGGSGVGYQLNVSVGGSGSSTVTIHTYNSTSRNPAD